MHSEIMLQTCKIMFYVNKCSVKKAGLSCFCVTVKKEIPPFNKCAVKIKELENLKDRRQTKCTRLLTENCIYK